jgi:hypothetical protein
MGGWSLASGEYSTSMGAGTYANGTASTAMGYGARANGAYSTAMGYYTLANSYDSLAIGQYNTGLSEAGATANLTTWVAADPLFEIGNGQSASTKSDALVVYKNGDTAISGTLTAAGLNVTGTTTLSSIALNATNSSLLLSGSNFVLPGQTLTSTASILTQNLGDTRYQLQGSSVNASQINTGILADTELSSNVDLLNTAQTVTGAKTFSGNVVVTHIVPQGDLSMGNFTSGQ